jgi:isopenicillin N synthase-like dioxygenase
MDSSKEQGINALNQDFNRYDQVNKEQSYHLSESADSDEEFDHETQIRTCDMSQFFQGGEAGKIKFAQELGEAFEGIGFAILEGHGVDPALYERGVAKTRELFETTTLEERMKFEAQRHGSVNQGYFPMKETTIIHPDLVEGWVFCRRALNMDGNSDFDENQFWPRPGYVAFFRQICLEHERLILPIMQSILSYLGCDPHLYDQKLAGTNFGFRLNYYPPMSEEDLASGAGRMLGHEDVDLWTILPSQSVDGLHG